jgi:O-antigen/teichoic acid export membrane protein
MTKDIYKRIGKNSLYNLSLKTLTFPLYLVLPPVILRFIGVEGYGVWAFIQVFINYGGVLNSGIDVTVTKYTAEYKAMKDHTKVAKLFNTFLVGYLFLFIIFFILVMIFHNWIIDGLMKTDNISREDIVFALIFYAATFSIKSIFKVYPSFLNGLERMDLTNKIEMVSFICNFTFSILLLYLGWGIKGLAIASAASALITSLVYIIVCTKVAPYLKFNPFFLSLDIISEAKQFIIYGAIGGITSMTHFQLSKLIISYFLGLKYLTYYDLGHKIVSAIFGFLTSFVTPIMPAASSVHKSLGAEKLSDVFNITFKYLALIAVPVFLFASILSGWIIFVWVGSGYEEAVFTLRFLSIAYLIMTLTGPGIMILTGMGLPKISFYGSLITAVTHVTLSFIFVGIFGFTGVVISELIAYALGNLYGLYYSKKILDVPVINILGFLKFPFLASMFIILILRFLGYVGNYYIALFSATILFSIIYTLLIYQNPAYEKMRDFIRRPLFLFTYRD